MACKHVTFFLCLLVALHVAGQTNTDTTAAAVTVMVTDSQTSEKVLSFLLADSAGRPIDSIRQIDTGAFSLQLSPGTYAIQIGAPGYLTLDTVLNIASAHDSFSIHLRRLSDTYVTTAPLAHEEAGENNTLLLIAFGVLALLTVGSVIMSVNARRKLQTLTRMYKAKSLMQTETSPPPLPIANDLAVVAVPATENVISETPPVEPVPIPKKHFVCELMMTAGPRKKFMSEENADRDLGEDVCGFVSTGHQVWMWLLDGTSDLHCLKNPADRKEYFSSRLLAIGVGDGLRKRLVNESGEQLNVTINSVIEEVKKHWIENINRLPPEEKIVLRKSIENKNFPECAITMITACLSDSGQFLAYRSGDSKMFVYGYRDGGLQFINTPLAEKNDLSNDRIFFRLWINEQGGLDIMSNDPLHEIVTNEQVSTLICFSDGVGGETEELLKMNYDTNPDQVRRDIMYQSQATGDDKSICFIQLNEVQSSG